MPMPLPNLVLPADTPPVCRDHIATLDAGLTNAAGSLAMEAETLRRSAALYRIGADPLRAADADRLADLLELDPRLYLAGTMYWHADGATKTYLHTYIRLLTGQAGARRDGRPLPEQSWHKRDWAPGSAAA
jgi:hypothetical protein